MQGRCLNSGKLYGGSFLQRLTYNLGRTGLKIHSIRISPSPSRCNVDRTFLSNTSDAFYYFKTMKGGMGLLNTVMILYCWDFSTQFVYCCRISDFPEKY